MNCKIFLISAGENNTFVGYCKKPIDLQKKLTEYLKHSKYHKGLLQERINSINPNEWKIELLEECQCNDINELKQKTQQYIQELNTTLNTHRAFLTDENRVIYKKEYTKKKYEQAMNDEQEHEKLLNTARYYYHKYREERLQKAKERRIAKAEREGRQLRPTRGRPRIQ